MTDDLPDAAPGSDAGESVGPGDPVPGGRALPLRLARLHLRMGMLALARAELESFAGSGILDEPALLDLAEVRWRTGDLAGAGEAADVAIGRGVEDPLAFVIAAEAVAGLGRPAEARRLAARALEATAGTLDAQFAGMPRSLIWPSEDAPGEASPDGAPPQAPPGAATIARGRQAQVPVAASAAAAEAFAGGRGALARGDTATAALRLGIAIRLEPGFAQAALAAIGDRSSTEPVLALVAGDALRLLGREHEALAAYDMARGRPPVTEGPALAEQEAAWPDD
jgi:tetratricopeptide (TPR) repeat protein